MNLNIAWVGVAQSVSVAQRVIQFRKFCHIYTMLLKHTPVVEGGAWGHEDDVTSLPAAANID